MKAMDAAGSRDVACWLPATLLAIASSVPAAPAFSAPASCARNGAPMVVGYFDHTAAWYRRRPQFGTDAKVTDSWRSTQQDATVVLYNDISTDVEPANGGPPRIERMREAIDARERDIAAYLDEAHENGHVKVFLQVPDWIGKLWATDAGVKPLFEQFVVEWSRKPALAGFYLFDEPELDKLPVRTLQEMAAVVRDRARAGRNLSAVSVAYSGEQKMNPLIADYSRAAPRAFDVLLVNRYPIYRKYAAGGAAASPSMAAKLGLSSDKARQENLDDNEFSNLDNYRGSVATAAGVAGLDGRPVYASMQAFGLLDSCAGPSCKATKERRARRSPTWNELLYLFSSIWASGADGSVLYSRYFSLHDRALRRRVDNLENLMGDVFRNLPDCQYKLSVTPTSPARRPPRGTPGGMLAGYAAKPPGGKPEYLVVLHDARDREGVRIVPDPALRVSRYSELRFDAQGGALEAAPLKAGPSGDGKGQELELTFDGIGVRIIRLHYD